MKVLALTPLYLPFMGGIEILVDTLARGLRERSVETVVVTDAAGGLPRFGLEKGTPVHRFELFRAIRSGKALEPLAVLRDLAALVEAEQPDIIHLHSVTQASAFYLDRLLRKMPRRPRLVATQHGVLEAIDQIGLTREMLLQADVLTAVSDAALDSALAFSGRTGPSVRIYNGIARFRDAVTERIMPSRHALLCVGRLQREKGFDLAIDALAQLREGGHDVSLTLIGHGEDQAALVAQAAALGVSAHVTFRGVLDHASTLRAIAEATLLLAPSRTREGFSLVAAEAALAGTPCIASDVGGLPETVEDGVSGRIIGSEDAAALAKAIAELLSDRHLWHRMSVDAGIRAAAKFDLARCIEGYAELYDQMLTQSRGQCRYV